MASRDSLITAKKLIEQYGQGCCVALVSHGYVRRLSRQFGKPQQYEILRTLPGPEEWQKVSETDEAED